MQQRFCGVFIIILIFDKGAASLMESWNYFFHNTARWPTAGVKAEDPYTTLKQQFIQNTNDFFVFACSSSPSSLASILLC